MLCLSGSRRRCCRWLLLLQLTAAFVFRFSLPFVFVSLFHITHTLCAIAVDLERAP
jgi:hypothetical protein